MSIFTILNVVFSILLIIFILLQQNMGGMGFSNDAAGQSFSTTKSGAEKFLLYGTVFLAVGIFVISILSIIYTK